MRRWTFAIVILLSLLFGRFQATNIVDELKENMVPIANIIAISNPAHFYRSKEQVPFLVLSWIPQGHPRDAYRYSVSENGRDWGERHLYSYGVQGGDQMGVKREELTVLKKIDRLPVGLKSAYDVPCERLLSVSLYSKGQWITRYYDRRDLPSEIKEIAQLTKMKAIQGN